MLNLLCHYFCWGLSHLFSSRVLFCNFLTLFLSHQLSGSLSAWGADGSGETEKPRWEDTGLRRGGTGRVHMNLILGVWHDCCSGQQAEPWCRAAHMQVFSHRLRLPWSSWMHTGVIAVLKEPAQTPSCVLEVSMLTCKISPSPWSTGIGSRSSFFFWWLFTALIGHPLGLPGLVVTSLPQKSANLWCIIQLKAGIKHEFQGLTSSSLLSFSLILKMPWS